MDKIKSIVKKVPVLTWGSIVLIIFFAIFGKGFMSWKNLDNVLKNSSILIIVSMGMAMSIISGQMDLSIGGVMAASGMISAMYISAIGENITVIHIIITLLIGIGVGLVFGLFNGLMIGKYRFNYWLITFSTMSIGYGVAQIVTNGNLIAGFEKPFRFIGSGDILFSTCIWWAIIIVIIMTFVIKKKRLGYNIFAIGDNEQCAAQSGVNVAKTRFLLYTISGILAGFAGVILVAKTNSANSTQNGYEFNAIAAVVVGGTSLDGGKGGVSGTIVGAIILQAVKSGLQLIGLNTYWQQTLIGVFILLIIIIDVLKTEKVRLALTRRKYKDNVGYVKAVDQVEG